MKIARAILLLSLLISACQPAETRKSSPTMRLVQSEEKIDIFCGDAPVLSYWTAPHLADGLPEHYRRSGFIHPVFSPDGKVLTDDFPAGHAHQHGLFFAWAKASFRDTFVDFWNQHKELGTVEHVEVIEASSNADTARFKSRLQHRSLQHGVVLEEIWTVSVSSDNGRYFIDLISDQTNLSEDSLYLQKHLYGGLGLRGSKHWNPDDSLHYEADAVFRTSAGLDREAANHTRPLWTAIYGPIGGDTVGMKIYDDPDNFRHPQPVRVHPEMPYLSVAAPVSGDFAIPPGGEYHAQYRIEVFSGGLD